MPQRPPIHRPLGWKPAQRGPTAPFYRSPAHAAFRAAVLKRDGYRCTAPDCETPNRGAGGRLIADHRIPRSQGGPSTLSNGQTLCPACDNKKHREKGG